MGSGHGVTRRSLLRGAAAAAACGMLPSLSRAGALKLGTSCVTSTEAAAWQEQTLADPDGFTVPLRNQDAQEGVVSVAAAGAKTPVILPTDSISTLVLHGRG